MRTDSKKPRRILILGGGFAGIYAYLELHKQFHKQGGVEITLVSDRDFFLFVTLIHEVATGNLLPLSITQPIRTLPHCCLTQFIQGTVQSINLDDNRVVIQTKEHSSLGAAARKAATSLSYDYLILALGSETTFFGIPGAREYALPLKSNKDAAAIKNRILENFEYAQQLTSDDERSSLLRFVVIGGGPTGIELAGEIADLVNHEMRRAFPLLFRYVRVTLIQSRSRLVPLADEWFNKKAQYILRNKHVEILLNTTVEAVHRDAILTSSGSISSTNAFWTAGVQARSVDISSRNEIQREERTRRIKVTDFLNLEKYPNVFIVGDQAWICNKETGRPYPMRAQFATREGVCAAQNINRLIHRKNLKTFSFRDMGIIFSLGNGGALAKIFGIKFSGFFAWWLYRTAYLMKIVGSRAKFRTVVEWTLNLFYPRDISKL
ncbi:MAG: hypothetical protein COU08_04380 [Candidatus Harrisonbacteria bacterium CG10_big_fil_rev_8_21_14_0_10_42_17]|uniref:NADH:ubiquinone reductase (non-electrogenic) n=1 Tax=Candidatus Harrisonbacteria bacterium CG10_big_fil_rev_8_21_14_0_10_42_17 TaxID=1974584 RepID=A0A2M6WGZ0_9BACT|nr:MAG: hypothetical protein COU08_04380 [Candidatus Harrisonbacteria bacterium CG10_big_fil_rev_8_21_14_0_10_42_17]